jgi:LacI family transcriptional regulator
MGKYTVKDIARIAGVAVGTVSRVINNNPNVKDETRIKVLKIIEELNYTPNILARNLKKKKKDIVGILINGFPNIFFDDILNGIDEELRKKNLTSFIHYTEKDNFETSVTTLIEHQVKGIIYLGGNSKDNFQNIEVPLVLILNALEKKERKKYSSVRIDDKTTAYNATNFLINSGTKKIAMIISNYDDNLALKRIEVYKKALKENNLKYQIIAEGNYTIGGGYRAAKDILKKEEPDAIFAISDLMAIGATRYILENNYKIPKDISILGFDGIEETKYYYPSITTIEQPRKEMGKLGAKLIIKEIKNNDVEKKEICLNVKFIERESTKK